jgi:hypothetical protein
VSSVVNSPSVASLSRVIQVSTVLVHPSIMSEI